MTEIYRATFSNGTVITSRRVRKVYRYAWHATGYHRLSNQPWSFHAFSGTKWQAAERMGRMIEFAQPDRIGFAEVVEVELIEVGIKQVRKPSHPTAAANRPQTCGK
jgi:hypothetical protein